MLLHASKEGITRKHVYSYFLPRQLIVEEGRLAWFVHKRFQRLSRPYNLAIKMVKNIDQPFVALFCLSYTHGYTV